jgi:steroid delta-isomerase-like uncharacterized protein
MSNKHAVLGFYAVVSGADPSALDAVFAPDFAEHESVPGLPAGREGIKQWAAAFRSAFPDGNAAVEDMIEEGDTVVARARLTGTQSGPFLGIAAHGGRLDVEVIDIFRFAGGQVAEHWGAVNTALMLSQLSGMPDR